MKAIPTDILALSALCGSILASCVYPSNPVPDMPYRPRRHAQRTEAVTPAPTAQPLATAPAASVPAIPATPQQAPATTDAWLTSRAAQTPAKAPLPAPAVATQTKPAPAVSMPGGNHITQAPVVQVNKPTPAPVSTPASVVTPARPTTPVPAPATVPAPAPAATPAPAPVPSPAPAAASEPKLISNDGPIPVATRVPGDPLRVYNPLDPSKKIKVIDKNGNPQPSGKKLKVPGTNFFFYVP